MASPTTAGGPRLASTTCCFGACAWIELGAWRAGARPLVGALHAATSRLPSTVSWVVVAVESAETLTIETVTALAIGRRMLAARGQRLVLYVPSLPESAGTLAVLGLIPYVVAGGEHEERLLRVRDVPVGA
ncbi:MAG: hypothetical protein QM572_04455 [Nocardioides sp.]|uniref:hypothetical protein n=1 Tax=Nocardioides sp. TaxID=35761 RepID=UPI0039E4A229